MEYCDSCDGEGSKMIPSQQGGMEPIDCLECGGLGYHDDEESDRHEKREAACCSYCDLIFDVPVEALEKEILIKCPYCEQTQYLCDPEEPPDDLRWW